MSNPEVPLVHSLGSGYVNEFLRGALFSRGDTVYMLRNCDSDGLSVHKLSIAEDRWLPASLPIDALSSFSDIKWPKLGYRNFPDSVVGNSVSFISNTRSVHRGLRVEHLQREPLATVAGWTTENINSITLILGVFFPTWIPFKEGMSRVKAKQIAEFAINEDVALSLSIDQGPDRYVDIYYRGRVIGQVREGGDIIISNKSLKRSNLKQLYSLLEN